MVWFSIWNSPIWKRKHLLHQLKKKRVVGIRNDPFLSYFFGIQLCFHCGAGIRATNVRTFVSVAIENRYAGSCLFPSRRLQSVVCFQPPWHRLVGGMETVPHAWPWTVEILFKGHHHCGGALIHPEIVLTAAHCFGRRFLPSAVYFIKACKILVEFRKVIRCWLAGINFLRGILTQFHPFCCIPITITSWTQPTMWHYCGMPSLPRLRYSIHLSESVLPWTSATPPRMRASFACPPPFLRWDRCASSPDGAMNRKRGVEPASSEKSMSPSFHPSNATTPGITTVASTIPPCSAPVIRWAKSTPVKEIRADPFFVSMKPKSFGKLMQV